MKSAPAPEVTSARLKAQYAPAYLTLTSIIQGVAITALVVHVEAGFDHLDAADWLLAAATLGGLLLVWHEYLMQALAFVWVPTLLDSVVPFAFLLVELFLAHFVFGNQRAWLLAAGLCFAVGAAAWGATRTQARAEERENVGVLGAVGDIVPLRFAVNLITAGIFLVAWAVYDALGLDRAQFVVALLAFIVIAACIGATVPYWNRVLSYARGDATIANDR